MRGRGMLNPNRRRRSRSCLESLATSQTFRWAPRRLTGHPLQDPPRGNRRPLLLASTIFCPERTPTMEKPLLLPYQGVKSGSPRAVPSPRWT